MGRISALDGLRGICVLGVLLVHADVPFARGGFLGVDGFFVLSGYLITTLLLREHARTGRIDLPAFYLRRALRLLPALFVLLAAVLAWAILHLILLVELVVIALIVWNYLIVPVVARFSLLGAALSGA